MFGARGGCGSGRGGGGGAEAGEAVSPVMMPRVEDAKHGGCGQGREKWAGPDGSGPHRKSPIKRCSGSLLVAVGDRGDVKARWQDAEGSRTARPERFCEA